MTKAEVEDWQSARAHDYGLSWGQQQQQGVSYLGEGMKGLYVCAIGGLPLFASGARVENRCNDHVLCFTEPCDTDHLMMVATSDPQQQQPYKRLVCARSHSDVGAVLLILDADQQQRQCYEVNVGAVRFLLLDTPWPIESQPENFWGTEGQYRAWNNHDLSSRPLSY